MKSILLSVLTALLTLNGSTVGVETTEQTFNDISNYDNCNYIENACPNSSDDCLCENYIDDDNNGVCDNYDNNACHQRKYMHGNGNCVNNDNDYICYNCVNNECSGKAQGHGRKCNK